MYNFIEKKGQVISFSSRLLQYLTEIIKTGGESLIVGNDFHM